MQTPVILSARRTPIGKFQGGLSRLPAVDLGSAAIASAIELSGAPCAAIDEVIMGHVLAAGTGQAPARQAALQAGIPPTVAALAINKVCGSGLKAIMLAAQSIRCGENQVAVAGGMESMSRSPYLQPRENARMGNRTLVDSMLHDGLVCAFSQQSMGAIADNLARTEGISREEQDRFACESHRRATKASQRGDFQQEIAPVTYAKHGQDRTVEFDEGPREGVTLESMAKLPAAFEKDGSVTAGNASMISDGAAALVVASEKYANENQLAPLARIVSVATAGGPPEELFTTPTLAIAKALSRANLTLSDIDLFEISEAFAVQMLACLRRLQISQDQVNVHGGAIALGHPIGASGARVAATLVHALRARDQRRGVAALCLGGGNAVAMVVERP